MFSFFKSDGTDQPPATITNATGHQLIPTSSSPPSSASSGFTFFSRASDSRTSSGPEVELSDIEDGSRSSAAARTSSSSGSFKSFFDRSDDEPEPSSSATSGLGRFSSFRTILGASSPSDSDVRGSSVDDDSDGSRSSDDLSHRLSGVVDSVRGYITGQPVAPPPPVDNSLSGRAKRKCAELTERFGCASMSYTQRIIGFGICTACGILCGIAVRSRSSERVSAQWL